MSAVLFVFAFTTSFSQLGAFLTCQGPCIEVAGYPGAGKGSCIFITKERASWSESNLLCRQHGAQPVLIPDTQTNDVIHTAVRQLSPVQRPWIGGQVTPHPWTWVTGSPFYNETGCCSGSLNADLLRRSPPLSPSLCVTSCRSHQYQYAYVKGDTCGCSNNTCTEPGSVNCSSVCDGNWTTSCPVDLDNSIKGYSTNGDVHLAELSEPSNACGVLQVQGGRLSIVTHSCKESLRFLCENDFNNSLFASTDLLSFLDSRMSCLSRGSDLLVIPDSQSNLTQLDNGSYWIGLTRFSIIWYPDQPALFYSMPDFDNHYIGGCFFVDPMSIPGHWFVDNCTRHRHALCIQDPEGHVIPDQDSLPQNDSIIFIPDEGGVEWCKGEKVCQDHGGHLVVIPDQNVDALVLKFLENIFGDVWIGGKIPSRPWSTVKGQRLYHYSGCCSFVQTDESETFPAQTNCAAICVPLCKQHGFQYAYLKPEICACSNTTCPEDYSGLCPDKCQGLEELPETCGNGQENFYTVYDTTELDLPPWNPDGLQTIYYCAALEIKGSTAFLTSWGCDASFQYMCSMNGTDSESITTHEEQVSWLKARERCLENGGDLAIVGRHSPLLSNLTSGKYWVGISQFMLIWHTGVPMWYNRLDKFSDGDVNGCIKLSRYPPYWKGDKCHQKLKPLCFKATPQTTKPSTQETSANTVIPPSHFTGETTTSSSDHSTVPNTTSSTPKPGPPISRNRHQTNKVIIGCTVTVSVVLVVAVCLILIKCRSKALQYDVSLPLSPVLNRKSATTSLRDNVQDPSCDRTSLCAVKKLH